MFLFSKGQLMRRILTSALVLGLFSTVGLIGCGEESSVKTTVDGPNGSLTKETKVTTEGTPPVVAPGTTPTTTP